MELTYIYTSIYVYIHGIILLYTYNNNIQLTQCIAPDNGRSDGSQSQSCNGSSAPATISKNCHHSMHYYKIFIIDWSKDASPVVVIPCSEQAGPRVQLPSDPLGLFSLFFDDTLVDLIVEETNRYAEGVVN